ncbi:hypothetical protein PV08_01970 [Exophiala spinifera]|uniref:SUN domain-containing protein n=1 Tax=Exophiala spinifera TaxID=91928 RepID=A0A0D2BSI4_9EURO|nr:uncharacterized protein PV08_01970 [Exophiala spinifera]KIW21390.1 hypothetical protein PV08_01970 [Exophiala spinifera]
MPPRRSTARGPSATPVRGASPTRRSTRANSVVSPENAAPQRTTRGASRQSNLAEGAGADLPRLPEVKIQQSYAYGSSKTPMLPTQLIPRGRMNLREIAATLDAGVEQADQHLRDHADEAHANLQRTSRGERAHRRASRENSQDPSAGIDDVEKSKTQRVAAWASSLESSQLDEIPEEDVSRSTAEDVASHKDTDPSSFPSGIFEHSYNYERGLRRPNITVRQVEQPFLRKTWAASKHYAQQSGEKASQLSSSFLDWTQQLLQESGRVVKDLPHSSIIPIFIHLLFVMLMMAATSLLFCYSYNHFVCDPYTTSPVGLALQKYCGSCVRSPDALFNVTGGNNADLSKLSATLSNLNSQIRSLELRLNDKIDTQFAKTKEDMEKLRQQQFDLSNRIAGLNLERTTSSGDVASPVIAKVNYFSPKLGALVEPRLTSPTLLTPLSIGHRVFWRLLGSAYYQTQQAEAALSAWQDVGDCWCSSPSSTDQDTMRLGVRTARLIYPKEVVLENYPVAGSRSPGATPKHIEIWADFEHLDSREWMALGIRSMQGDSPIGPTWGMIGQMEYDASKEAPHVQAFRLDVNDHSNIYSAQRFVVRVVSNYGSDFTCLYRVRMHGAELGELSTEKLGGA